MYYCIIIIIIGNLFWSCYFFVVVILEFYWKARGKFIKKKGSRYIEIEKN